MAAGDRERWNDKWTKAGIGTSHGSQLTELLSPWLPAAGAALDLAGGAAATSIELARRGLDVTVADISDVGLSRAHDLATAEGVEIATLEIDLEQEPLPPGPWAVIVVANYLQRDLFPAMVDHLDSDGLLGVAIATTVNLERHARPGVSFLLQPDELPALAAGATVLHHSEAWRSNGRHEAHLVARR